MGPRGIVRASTVVVTALSITLLLLTALQPGAAASFPLRAEDGERLEVPEGPVVLRAFWQGLPVLVFKVPASEIPNGGTPSIEAPGEQGLRIFVISAKSTHLGCVVEPLPMRFREHMATDSLARPGLLIDPCHQFIWDAYGDGAEIRGFMPRLPLLDAHFEDGVLVATGYDGPVGPQR